jgi:hypothetical protein
MNTKKKLVVSFKNLSPELQEEVKKQYPLGFSEKMMRIDLGPDKFFYAVPFETDDASYLVKINVKIDTKVDDEDEKDYFDEDGEIKDAEEIADQLDEDDED